MHCPTFGSTQLSAWITTASLLPSHPIPIVVEPGPLFCIDSHWISREVQRSGYGVLSAFSLNRVTTTPSKWCISQVSHCACAGDPANIIGFHHQPYSPYVYIYGGIKCWMSHHDVGNLLTLIKSNIIGLNVMWLCAVQGARLLSKSSAEQCSSLCRSWSLPQIGAEVSWGPKICLSYNSTLVAFWMHLHNVRCFQAHLRMLLQSLRAHWFAPGGSGSTYKNFEALVKWP